ncbi:hypothetical protein BDP27DRAFT_663310 [Rhodocollybia butyracea]|uniref:Uncharacterized protein n=1 Tax=Rhodocollybia butyracea TaxID=206335 RepID=A0A9P5U9C8_9AGAR|nr:hypothetical protein BDP27DRAFT_663310 [Rhodocollybia butyracea]
MAILIISLPKKNGNIGSEAIILVTYLMLELKRRFSSRNTNKLIAVLLTMLIVFCHLKLRCKSVSPECVPYRIRGIPCLAIGSPSLHAPVLGSGTLVPASIRYRRALVLAPLFHTDRIYYILCLHDDHDVFLIRVHERFMDNRWSCWKQLKQTYGGCSLGALFSAGTDTYEQIIEGVKRQRSARDRRRWKEQLVTAPLTFVPSIWNSLINPRERIGTPDNEVDPTGEQPLTEI